MTIEAAELAKRKLIEALNLAGGSPLAFRAMTEVTIAIDKLAEEIEDMRALCDKLSDILTRTVNVLRGEPPPLTLWSWHDLPELASAAKQEAKKARTQLDAHLFLDTRPKE